VSRYKISRELESAIAFPEPVRLDGLVFESIDPTSGKIVGIGESEGADIGSAVAAFENRMRQVLDALAICRVAAVSSYGGSLFVSRPGTSLGFLRHVKTHREEIPLTPGHRREISEVESAVPILASDDGLANAARHYRESLSYASSLVAAMHLLRAAEALARTITASPKCSKCRSDMVCAACNQPYLYSRTDPAELEEIIGTSAYEYFYKKPGLRNLLMHGAEIDQEQMSPHAASLREGVQRRIRSLAGAAPAPPLDRPRSLFGYQAAGLWLETRSRFPDFRRLLEMADERLLTFESEPRLLREDEKERIRNF
jgi:hypothetical protein